MMDGVNILDLKGQVALVTGAGQGAGRAMALMLAQHGAGGVAVNDFHGERAEAVAEEIRALGVPALAVPFDVSNLEAVRAGFVAAATLGPVTLLVNNAGMAGPTQRMAMGPVFWESDPAEWSNFFATNTFGTMNCCHTAVPGMIAAGRGRIVTILSDSGRVGDVRTAAYSAAKAAAGGFVRSLAKELGRYNITCNGVSLSTLEPPLEPEQMEAFLAMDRTKTQLSSYVLRRFGKPDDVAGMVLFLCSDAAGWITGQTYPVNGGYSFAV